MSTILTQETQAHLDRIIARYDVQDGTLLMLLREVETLFQYSLPTEVLDYLSRRLNIPLAQLYGVITFYSLFSTKPRGKYIIRICESPPCHLMGSESIIDHLKSHLNIGVGETTPDGRFTLELTSCLGICAVAPAMMINDEMVGNLTPSKINEILSKLP
ncbi:MAG: NAD(P)H-dependent oxidoreductase subunit E [Candidatus Delongbacteria bacterium]|nr:NAD(P)H-dependent oxidoreductase subunit E [Candidatus Delongbacteria bacterium]